MSMHFMHKTYEFNWFYSGQRTAISPSIRGSSARTEQRNRAYASLCGTEQEALPVEPASRKNAGNSCTTRVFGIFSVRKDKPLGSKTGCSSPDKASVFAFNTRRAYICSLCSGPRNGKIVHSGQTFRSLALWPGQPFVRIISKVDKHRQ